MSCLFNCFDNPVEETILGVVEELAELMEPVEDRSTHDPSRKASPDAESRRINFTHTSNLMILMVVSV